MRMTANSAERRQEAQARTLVDLARDNANRHPDKRAYTYLGNGEDEQDSLTFAALDARARAIATALIERNATGQRVLIVYRPGLDYVAGFVGCLYAGAIAVPTYPPRPNRIDERLVAIAGDARPAAVLTTAELLAMRSAQTAELGELEWVATDQIEDSVGDGWVTPDIGPDSLAYLQYTSGSTGTPKGVEISHRNLLANLEDMDRAWPHDENSVMVSWLPLFHDMGLIYGILEPLYKGFSCYFMRSISFSSHPFRWLQAISRYHATHSAAPNFAFDLCVRKITQEERASLDLTSLQSLANGAEPVHADTLRRFNDTFAGCGLSPQAVSPGYGLAEATLTVARVRIHDQPVVVHLDRDALAQDRIVEVSAGTPHATTLVGCGSSDIDTCVAILDPEHPRRVAPCQVGEICVAGETVARGYWRRAAETSETFGTILEGDIESDGPYLRTGDLGFLRDGELFITGRLKDVIIVQGANYYPQDIERIVEQSDPSLRESCGAAFSVEADGEERLVVIQEVERTHLKGLDGAAVSKRVRQAITENQALRLHALVLVRPATVPKTSSGKIQRRLCRSKFLEGTLQAVHEWPGHALPGEEQ